MNIKYYILPTCSSYLIYIYNMLVSTGNEIIIYSLYTLCTVFCIKEKVMGSDYLLDKMNNKSLHFMHI